MKQKEIVKHYKAIKYEFINVIRENREIVKEMIDHTDDYYGLIAEFLPGIEEKIEDSLTEISILINSFSNTGEIISQERIYKVLIELKRRLENLNHFFQQKDDLHKILANIITDQSKEKETAFKKIIIMTKGLKKILNKLKVLAINSSIYTYNHHNQMANGFEVISDKIHFFSEKMRENYQNIEIELNLLLEWQQSFQEDIEKTISMEDSIINKYNNDLAEVFKDFFAFLDNSSKLLTDLLTSINEAIDPVQDLMLEIQNQDLIRQKLENLNNILAKTVIENSEKADGISEEDIPGQLAFILEVIKVSEKLLSSVQEQINKSRQHIEQSLLEMFNKITIISNDLGTLKGTLLIERTYNLETAKEDLYMKIFSLLPSLQGKVEEINNNYTSLLNSENIFRKSIGEINNQFYAVNKHTERLQSIRVLASIELNIMKDDNNFINKIDQVINQIVSRNEDDISSYNLIQDQLEGDFSKFKEIVFSTEKKMSVFITDIKDSKKNLILIRETIRDKFLKLNAQIEELSGINTELRNGLKQFDNLSSLFNSFVNNLNEIRSGIEKIKKSFPEEDYSINNISLLKLFEEFTSYQERKTVSAEYHDISMDVGDSGGELTLF
ncbi:MAG: hypothetical protein ACOCRO_03350 [Halanaerobiales bacterium]